MTTPNPAPTTHQETRQRTVPKIRFETSDREVEFEEGDDVNVLRVAIRNDCGVPWKCASGLCGTDRITVVEGLENFEPPRRRERERL
ncbi:hypothetical protein CRN30_02260, partial [Vibrio vulnificus]